MATAVSVVSSITLANAQAWWAIKDPYARDQYLQTLMAGLSVSPVDDFAISLARSTCKNLLGTVGSPVQV